MIREVEGDILHSKAEAVAHGLAVDDDFKQGLCLSLRERWPSLYKDFRHYCQTKSPAQGGLWTWKGSGGVAPGTATIINLFTQLPPRRPGDRPGKATLSNVAHSLKALAAEIEKQKYKSVAITRLSTGVGGLEWSEVRPLIEQYLGPLRVPVYVYSKFVKDQVAREE